MDKKRKVFGCGLKVKRSYRAWRSAGYSLGFARQMATADIPKGRTGREKLSPPSEKKEERLAKGAALFAK